MLDSVILLSLTIDTLIANTKIIVIIVNNQVKKN